MVVAAREEGLNAYHCNAMNENLMDEIRLANISGLLGMTSSDEVNMLTMMQYSEILGRDNVYRLLPDVKELQFKDIMKKYDQGLYLFGKGNSHSYLTTRINSGATVKSIKVEKEFNYDSFRKKHGDRAIMLAAVSKSKKVSFYTLNQEIKAEIGDTLLILI